MALLVSCVSAIFFFLAFSFGTCSDAALRFSSNGQPDFWAWFVACRTAFFPCYEPPRVFRYFSFPPPPSGLIIPPFLGGQGVVPTYSPPEKVLGPPLSVLPGVQFVFSLGRPFSRVCRTISPGIFFSSRKVLLPQINSCSFSCF